MSEEDSSTLGRLQDAAIRTVDRVIDDGEQQLEDDSVLCPELQFI